MMKIPPRLPDELEQTVRDVIRCCISVHRELGPGLLEGIYARAVEVELQFAELPFAREVEIPIHYRGLLLLRQRLDFVVAKSIVLELKAVDALTGVHRAQILSYLRASAFPVGLLINFNQEVLKDGLKRFVL